MTGKTISIYIPDGNARSIKICDIDNSILQAIFIPRNKLKEASKLNELNQQGIYFLIGGSDEDLKPTIYIGEAEKLINRLNQHNINKEFWNKAICFISVKKNLNKAHVKFLENYCWNKAKEINKCNVETSTPAKTNLTNSEKDLVLNIYDDLKILISTLGYPILEETKKEKKNIFVCKGKDAWAEGEYSEDGFIVFKGSKANLLEVTSAEERLKRFRQKLILSGILKNKGNILVFTEDYTFTSPSAASDVVLARSSNGWTSWKDKDGKNLDERIRRK